MLRISFRLILILFSLSSVCDAEDLTLDALIGGVNQARLTIQSGEVQAIITVKRAAQKSEDEIAVWKQAERERELKAFIPDAAFPNLGLKEFEEDYLTPHLDFNANWYRQRTEIEHATTLFHILEPDVATLPTLYQYKITRQERQGLSLDSQGVQHLQDSRFYLLAYDMQTQVKQDIGNVVSATAKRYAFQLFKSDRHGGYLPFSLFGRALYRVPADAKQVGKERIEGAECHMLVFDTEGGLIMKIWIDVSKDFCIRKAEYRRTSSTQIFSRTVYKQFQQFGDIWFPKIKQNTLYREDGTVRNENRVEIENAQFNVDFPKDFFQIDRDFYREQMGRIRNTDAP